MTINSSRLFQLFKYTVYVLLAFNVYLFFDEEFKAAALQFPNGIDLLDIIEAYSATIDTLAWVVLLLMFELETYVLEDENFTKTTSWVLHGMRTVCYAFIVYAFYGYLENLAFVSSAAPLDGVADICRLVPEGWSWSTSLDEYTKITAENCAILSNAEAFLLFPNTQGVVDQAGLTDIIRLAWVDVINAAVWLLVVLVLEIDVRLQEHNRYEGLALKASNVIKFVLYFLLLLAAIYWGFKGGFVDFWDAFLWLVAFVFIELNVFEWRQEENAALAAQHNSNNQSLM